MSKSQREVISRAPRAVAHLRDQLKRHRLGLIFGSGASKDLEFPEWKQLVESIAAHPQVRAKKLLARFRSQGTDASPITRSLASVTQMLFGRFREREIRQRKLVGKLDFIAEQEIKTDWLRLIHGELYRRIKPNTRPYSINKHPYLTAFREIIKSSPLTVNYNFDDTLEKLLHYSRDSTQKNSTRGYEVIDKPNAQFQKDCGVIYHPNGFLPSIFEDGSSEEVIFSDESFQDQLISAATGKYVHLSNHLFRNTCLLIGLSLEDVTLQSLLRQSAVSNPGNVHYIIHFRRKDKKIDKATEETVFKTNFSCYNLYTLFLDVRGIRSLAELLSMDSDDFALAYPAVHRKFVYYLIGSVAAGKSTATGNFRNLTTYDEWIDERKPELAVPGDTLSVQKERDVDSWVVEQFRKKNYALLNNKQGIHLIDRCPLDPLTFGKPEQRTRKAKKLVGRITAKGKWNVVPGHIIHLDCDLMDVRIRNSLKHKKWPDAEHKRLFEAIGQVYGPLQRSVICTRGRNANAVASEVARVIFLDDYNPIDIGNELTRIAEQKHAP
jgi:hypothetical protein